MQMKVLLSTTAIVLALGLPTLVLAQTTPPAEKQAAQPATDKAQQKQGQDMSGFLAERSQSDVFASDLLGHDVKARRVQADNTGTESTATMNADGTHGMVVIKRANLDEMDDIGQINEIVLSSDGQIRAVVIGVGGFLGVGEQDIAVTMEQVTFATDPDDNSKMYIVVNTGADMLRDAPAYQRSATKSNAAKAATPAAAATNSETTTDRKTFAAPAIERDGYKRVTATEVSSDMLVGESVYHVDDKDLGTVTKIIIDDAGTVTNVIIDFGSFLGIGKSQASIGFDELTILSTEGQKEVRLYVDATKKQIQDLPEYKSKS